MPALLIAAGQPWRGNPHLGDYAKLLFQDFSQEPFQE
jgi:hypothetical protein